MQQRLSALSITVLLQQTGDACRVIHPQAWNPDSWRLMSSASPVPFSPSHPDIKPQMRLVLLLRVNLTSWVIVVTNRLGPFILLVNQPVMISVVTVGKCLDESKTIQDQA
jgi:hypothetical protein